MKHATDTKQIQSGVAARARLRYLHIAPRKVRAVADIVRGLSLLEAEAQLAASPRRPSVPLLKLIRSAAQSAKEKGFAEKQNLFVSRIAVDEGPTLKRVERRARGSVNILQKGMSHVALELSVREGAGAPAYRVPEPERKEKKEKKAEKRAAEDKQETPTPKAPVERKERETKRGGGLKRIFRRKSV